jgi:hypothetical protein
MVIVVMENKNYGDIIGRPDEAPYLNSLAAGGATFSNSYAATPQPAQLPGLVLRIDPGRHERQLPEEFQERA